MYADLGPPRPERLADALERRPYRGRHQRVLGVEMAIEPAMREPRLGHDVADARAFDAALAKQP